MASHDLTAYLNTAVTIASEVGEMIRDAHNRRNADLQAGSQSHVHHKSDVDLVTETDRAVEKHVWSRLKAAYPAHAFVGEESSSEDVGNDPTWICDPIDGTTNFVHGNPYFCVSLAFAVEKRVLCGVIFNPITLEMFTAIRGQGAFLNGKRLVTAASHSTIANAVISTNVGYDRSEAGVAFVQRKLGAVLALKARGINLSGSAALQLAYVAAGRFDCFYEWGIHSWDIASGVLLVEEAGGAVACCDGTPLDLNARNVLATNGKPLLEALLPPLAK